MHILIAPGAFKHSLGAAQVAQAIARGLERSGLPATYHLMPIADGGNGTLDAFLANGGQRIPLTVENPLGQPIEAAYGLLPDGQTAVIEMALASGIELTPQPDAMRASTYGTGQLMRAALEHGITRLIVGLGGSATTDGGAGCLQALGVRLLDVDGQPIPSGGAGLAQLDRIDTSGLDPRWSSVEVLIASDVENPPVGEQGAAVVFAPQKGASAEQVTQLDANLRHYFTRIRDQLGVDVLTVRGGGAAGAFAAGLMALLGGRIVSGIDLILAHNRFETALESAALVITGEGQIDAQTIGGKGPLGVALAARQRAIPVIALVGGLNIDERTLHTAGINAIIPIVTRPMPLEDALRDAAHLVEAAALRLGYLLQVGMELNPSA